VQSARPGEIAAAKQREPQRSKIAIESSKQAGKDKAPSGNAGKLAANQQKPGAPANPRTAVTDAKKLEGREKTQPAGAGKLAANQHKPAAMANPKAGGEVKKPDSKDKGQPTSSGKTAATQSKPSATLPTSKTKTPAAQANKQDAKSKGRSASSDEDGKAAVKGTRQAAPARKS
jgi:hypothetical protein